MLSHVGVILSEERHKTHTQEVHENRKQENSSIKFSIQEGKGFNSKNIKLPTEHTMVCLRLAITAIIEMNRNTSFIREGAAWDSHRRTQTKILTQGQTVPTSNSSDTPNNDADVINSKSSGNIVSATDSIPPLFDHTISIKSSVIAATTSTYSTGDLCEEDPLLLIRRSFETWRLFKKITSKTC